MSYQNFDYDCVNIAQETVSIRIPLVRCPQMGKLPDFGIDLVSTLLIGKNMFQPISAILAAMVVAEMTKKCI